MNCDRYFLRSFTFSRYIASKPRLPNSTRCQIFLRDPNNVEIELNYDTKNESAA